VPDMEDLSPAEITRKATEVKKLLDGEGLVAEFVAPRLWESPKGIDGGYTSNCPKCREWAIERSKRMIDICNALGTKLVVLWLAREGTYIRESKNPLDSHRYLVEALDAMLKYDAKIEIAIESKPNEPMDHTYIPTVGHALALGHQTVDAKRVGGLIETAHAMLAGLDPSDEMAFALSAGKLWSVHLNDQNGLKFDQDKSFGAANLRGAYNQVRVLELAKYYDSGRFIGLDVKAMRSQKAEVAHKHLSNSRTIFLRLVEKFRSFPENVAKQCIADRDYEELELVVLQHLLGK
jgi:xylose isomerase